MDLEAESRMPWENKEKVRISTQEERLIFAILFGVCVCVRRRKPVLSACELRDSLPLYMFCLEWHTLQRLNALLIVGVTHRGGRRPHGG